MEQTRVYNLSSQMIFSQIMQVYPFTWHFKSIHNGKCHTILFYHPKKLFYQLYHIILQYTQHPNFYFTIQYIKII